MSDIYIQSKWPGVVKGGALCVHRIKDRRFWASVSPPVQWGLVLCDSNVRVHVERMKAILRSLPTPGYCAAMGTLGGNKPSCLINLTTSSKFLRDCIITCFLNAPKSIVPSESRHSFCGWGNWSTEKWFDVPKVAHGFYTYSCHWLNEWCQWVHGHNLGPLAGLGSIDTVSSLFPSLATYFVHEGHWIPVGEKESDK